ncbi:hypothetical protein [Paractinoplanes globisporus]|uniref:Uncharacterized protein n=1 Tax=Paractinoplanes globisporus TaxID=113565 RepID=A0ABW6WF57_9ACTN|nr:hypothetical protein [Actinoplanes globisporus]
MKFFSNDAKENTDEPEYGRDHTDVVTSDPVAVPQQRAGSPWSDGPGSTETATPAEASTDTQTDTSTRDDASTWGDTAADSETRADAEDGSPDDELAEQEQRDGTEEEPESRRDVSEVTTYGPDGSVTTHEDHDSTDGSAEDALRDEGTFDSPEAVEPATGDSLESDISGTSEARVEDETDRDRAEAAAEADETVEEARADEERAEAEINGTPVAVEPEPVPVASAADADEPEATPVAAAVPVDSAASTPGSGPATALDRLFTDGDSFAERFREIQLRFVDSPKEATNDAAVLVGEAVDRLTDALKAQKDALGGDSDDTEQLRVQLRSYRDLLNRLSAL